jgi:hypothetical protein
MDHNSYLSHRAAAADENPSANDVKRPETVSTLGCVRVSEANSILDYTLPAIASSSRVQICLAAQQLNLVLANKALGTNEAPANTKSLLMSCLRWPVLSEIPDEPTHQIMQRRLTVGNQSSLALFRN